jgi:hypothetical protein
LAQLTVHLSAKWDEVDNVEAAQLSGWLDSTRFLLGAPSAAPRKHIKKVPASS